MKILDISYEYPPVIVGGLGVYSHNVATRLAKRGHRVTVLAVNWENRFPERKVQQGVEVIRPLRPDISSLLKSIGDEEISNWPNLPYLSELIAYQIFGVSLLHKRLARGDCDLVIANDWIAYLAGKMIKDTHSLPLVCYAHALESGRFPEGGSRTIKEAERVGLESADLVITVSHSMREHIKGLGIPEGKICVIHNGVSVRKYRPRNQKRARRYIEERMGIQLRGRVLIYIGRLQAYKGILNLIEGFASAEKKLQGVTLVILGQGEESDEVRSLITEFGISEHVIFIEEMVDEDLKIILLASSDATIFPSTYEPFGIVALEAMAMGKPVIVGSTGINGMPEFVPSEGEGACGLHTDGRDPQSIAQSIIALFKSDCRSMGRQARSHVVANYDWDKVVSNLEQALFSFAWSGLPKP